VSSSYRRDSSSSSVGTIENPLYHAEFCALVGIFRNQHQPFSEELCTFCWHNRCSLVRFGSTNVCQRRGFGKQMQKASFSVFLGT